MGHSLIQNYEFNFQKYYATCLVLSLLNLFSHPFSHFSHLDSPSPFPLFLPFLHISSAPSLLSPGLPIHYPSSHNRRTDRTKKNQYASTFRNFVPNLPVSAILVLPVFSRIFQYLQYWYNQYFLESSSILQYWNNQHFPESSSICNTGITSISQNLPVSAILIF